MKALAWPTIVVHLLEQLKLFFQSSFHFRIQTLLLSNKRLTSNQCYPCRATKKQPWAFPSARSWIALLLSWPNCRNHSSHTSWGPCALRTTPLPLCRGVGWIHRRRRGKQKTERTSKRKTRTWPITAHLQALTPAVCCCIYALLVTIYSLCRRTLMLGSGYHSASFFKKNCMGILPSIVPTLCIRCVSFKKLRSDMKMTVAREAGKGFEETARSPLVENFLRSDCN